MTAGTDVSDLIGGIYEFELIVADSKGLTGTDLVKVTVKQANPPANHAPIANSGSDKIIMLPLNKTTLTGTGTDADGDQLTYAWKKISGPALFNIAITTSAITDLSNLVEGIYEFELTVTDSKGLQGTDAIKVSVNAAAPVVNHVPIANAGSNKEITLPVSEVVFSGSGEDVDGDALIYLWKKKSGPGSFNIVSATNASTEVGNLIEGTYEFELTVTDSKGLSATDLVKVVVNPAVSSVNRAPVADAGTDKIITLPVSSVTLSGSGTDVDGDPLVYQWKKTSGPASFTISSATDATTDVSDLIEGLYEFELTISDGQGLSGTDLIKVSVHAAYQQIMLLLRMQVTTLQSLYLSIKLHFPD